MFSCYFIVRFEIYSLSVLGLACLFIVVFVKKRFICIYNFLSQLSILLKNPLQKWIFVSFVFVCNLSVIIVCFRYKRV